MRETGRVPSLKMGERSNSITEVSSILILKKKG